MPTSYAYFVCTLIYTRSVSIVQIQTFYPHQVVLIIKPSVQFHLWLFLQLLRSYVILPLWVYKTTDTLVVVHGSISIWK